MLEENIKVLLDEEGFGEAEYSSIHNLVKEYFDLYIKDGIDGFDKIFYRGHEIFISDADGYADAITIEEDLRSQINEVNNIED